MSKIKTPGKVIIILVIAAGLLAGKVYWYDNLPREGKQSTEIGKISLPDAPEASLKGDAAVKLPLPTNDVSINGGTQGTILVMEWNAQFALMYANGGVRTTKNSLFDKAKLQFELKRQDDCNKSLADIAKFANDYKNNPSTPGVYAIYMGDGIPGLLSGLVKELEPLGPEYRPVAFYALGKSYGEDKLIGPSDWLSNPSSARGRTVACFLRDGDMNILLKWAGDNGILVNPDEKTFDRNAINLISANDYIDAGNKYITNYKEKRKLIVNGKITNTDTTVGVDAVATWTPVDVNIAEQKGGIVPIASTKEYSTQMPAIIITIRKYATDHRTDIVNMITALAQAGDQVRTFNEAKEFAANVSAKVYDDHDGSYWLKYYNGVKTKDAQGLDVSLGGSIAFNLKDAVNTFGLGKDGIDRYKVVYTTFGNLLSKMYPELMASYPEYSTIVDKTYVMEVVSSHPELLSGEVIKVDYSDKISKVVSSKSYNIQFETGSSTISFASYDLLDEILKSAVIAENLKVGVYGHTDNVGDPSRNQSLSEARAQAVKDYLIKKGLPDNRIESSGFGDTEPIASNATAIGKAKNRRVQISLGQ